MQNGFGVVLGSLALVVALLLGTTIVDSFWSDQSGIDERVTRDAAELESVGEFVAFADGKGTGQTVYKTTGYAVNLTGIDDSYVESDNSFTIASDDNWTISVWGYVDSEAAGENMSAVSANGRVIITYNGSANHWQAWYYDDGSTNSHVVNVSTSGNEAGNWTNVMAWSNGTHLAIYRNNTEGQVKDITTDNIAEAPVEASNWNGRLEEVRTFDEALDSANRSTVVNSPVEQLPDNQPTSRIMFDQPDKDTQLVLYTDASLTQSNVTFSAGFAEQIMDPKTVTNDLLGETDYRWDETGPKIVPTSGGELDGAPVAYASYDFDTALADAVHAWGDLAGLASIIPIIAIGVVILIQIRRIQA